MPWSGSALPDRDRGRDVAGVEQIAPLDIPRPAHALVVADLEVQQRVGIDRESIGVVGEEGLRHPFDVWPGIKSVGVLVEHLGAEVMRRRAGQAVIAPHRIVVEAEVAVGVHRLNQKRSSCANDRLRNATPNPASIALMHRAVRVGLHARVGEERVDDDGQALQLVPDIGAVERNVPGEIRPAAARADLVSGRGLGIDVRARRRSRTC